MNAWLGGFEAILKRMTIGNFDWFLHSMLFYHTRNVLERQQRRAENNEDEEDEEDEEDDDL